MNLPDKKYDIIYADPPWGYDNKIHDGSGGRDISEMKQISYDTMSDDDLKELPVKDICSKNSLCFMWVTSAFMSLGMEVMKAWGFEFKTVAFVWTKRKKDGGARHMPGFYTMGNCEYVIVGKRGSIPKPRGARNVRQLIEEEIREHSRKPDCTRDRITEMFPTQTKIELFARTSTPGWDVWGNETDKFKD